MFANSQRREGHLSSLNTAINALNLATEDSSIQRPATMDEFISTRDLLIMIRDLMADKTEWVELGLRCAEVCNVLDSVGSGSAQLMSTVAEMRAGVIKWRQRNAITRLVNSKSDLEAIVTWQSDINRILHSFNTGRAIRTHTVTGGRTPGAVDMVPIRAPQPSTIAPIPGPSTLPLGYIAVLVSDLSRLTESLWGDYLNPIARSTFPSFLDNIITGTRTLFSSGSRIRMSHSPSDPHLSPDQTPQPPTVYPIPNPSTPAEVEVSPCIRLATRAFSPRELVFLIDDILVSKDEVTTIGSLDRDPAQTFIDVVHEALDLPDLPPRLRKKCLTALCWICGRHGLLPKSLQIPFSYDRSDTPLYCGGFGDVWKGEHQGSPVAVKVLRVYTTSDFGKIISRFCKEVVTWNALRHPNVLHLLGVTMETHHFAMASEWMVNGNINEFVKAHRDANRFELLIDVARGLEYMHGQAMIHGDLKGANILIDEDRHARLADFGLLTIISDPTNFTASSSYVKCGTTRWMSPEILNPDLFGFEDSRPTKESDRYALGMVMLEVLSGQPPLASDKDFIVMRKVIEGGRPGRPEGPEGAWFGDDLWRMLEMCWAMPPESRPSIEAVLECLERVSRAWKPSSQQVPGDIGMAEGDPDHTMDSLHRALGTL